MRDQFSVLRSDGSSGNSGRKTPARVREPEVCAAHRSYQSSHGAQLSGRASSGAAIPHCIAVGVECQTCGGFLLVENLVEEHNLARNLLAPERLQLVEIVDHD